MQVESSGLPSEATFYPLALRLAGRRVLVVGGGAVATRRVPALLDAGALVDLVAPELTPALLASADSGRIRWFARRFVPTDVDGAWLVQTAVDDSAVAATVSAAANERRVFCVRADDRVAATAWTPAVTRYGPVTVAVLGGGDPRRAVTLRNAIRDRLSDGTLPAGETSPAGTRRADQPRPTDETLPVHHTDPTATGSGGEHPPGVAPWGAKYDRAGTAGAVPPAPEPSTMPGAAPRLGRVALVGAGPGDPELITVKGRRLLNQADVVVADRLVPGLLLDELRPEVELVDASKIPYGPARAQEEINRILVDRARAGAAVVRLKGGDPYVFGRGGEEVLACTAAGVPVTVVSGVSSSVAVPAAAGVPVTHRGIAHEFTVVSGHLPPDDPGSLVDWPALARLRGTLVILMGLRNLHAISAVLLANGRPPETPAAVVQEGTTAAQRMVRSTLGAVAADARAAAVRPPAVVVVGDVVAVADGAP